MVLAGGPVPAAGAALDDDRFRDSTSVVVVEVPVRVLVDGKPLRGLAAEDFIVRDEGVEREVLDLTVYDFLWRPDPDAASGVVPSAPGSPGARAPPGPVGRNYLFLFDLAYGGTDLIHARRRLEASLRALRTVLPRLTPADRVGIAYHSALRGLKLLLDFSSETAVVAEAVELMELVIRANPRRIEREFADWPRLAPSRPGWRAKTARGPLRASFDDVLAEARHAGLRGDLDLPHSSLVMYLTRGLRELMERTRVAGEKHLVLLSAGPILGEEAARSLRFLQELMREFRASNWTVQAVNTAGLGTGRDSLHHLARGTGGAVYANSRDLERLLGRMLDQTSLTYVLAFQLDDAPAEGRYRRLEVELRNPPKKARIVHRPGYFQPGRRPEPIPGRRPVDGDPGPGPSR